MLLSLLEHTVSVYAIKNLKFAEITLFSSYDKIQAVKKH